MNVDIIFSKNGNQRKTYKVCKNLIGLGMRKWFYIPLIISTILILSCHTDSTPLAEKEALHYCKCATPLAKVTDELLSEKTNYKLEDSLKIEERMSELSRRRSQFTEEMDNCTKDPEFQRYKERALRKMTSEEIEMYLEERVNEVMKHCPEVAQTLNFGT